MKELLKIAFAVLVACGFVLSAFYTAKGEKTGTLSQLMAQEKPSAATIKPLSNLAAPNVASFVATFAPATFTGAMSGASANPPNASSGTGTAVVTLDTVAHTLSVTMNFSGLLGTSTSAHIHCCASAGTNSGVAVANPTLTGFPLGVTSGSYTHTFDTTSTSTYATSFLAPGLGSPLYGEATLSTGLTNSQAYVDIHSALFPGGEIRAQFVPCAAIDTTITAAPNACPSSTGNTASVPDAGAGSTYLWQVFDGVTITSGQGTRSITWTAGTTTTYLYVTVTNAIGCSSTGSKQVVVDSAMVCGYEADVAPRPNGSGTVVVSDWVQVGRFSVGLDTAASGSETQRADCAPRATLGDGQITVADWVQAGRYSVGLDSVTQAGGPTLVSQSGPMYSDRPIAPRELRVASPVVSAGQQIVSVQVELVSQGGENGVTFSVHYDPTALTYEGYEKGGDVGLESGMLAYTDQASMGRLGFGVALKPGKRWGAGITELVRLQLRLRKAISHSTEIAIAEGPVAIGLADVNAATLPVSLVHGSVTAEEKQRNKRKGTEAGCSALAQ